MIKHTTRCALRCALSLTALLSLVYASPTRAQEACLAPAPPSTKTAHTPPKSEPMSDTTTPTSPRGDLNVLGTPLKQCCTSPLTGFERDGFCHTGPHDRGRHVVCAVMTEAFLSYTKAQGNDLSTPRPEYRFPGLKPGDRWCLCALRWAEAERAGVAPSVDLEATHQSALKVVSLEALKAHQEL